MQRDPDTLEGIELDCDRTNGKLREVYTSYIDAGVDLQSPSGAYYEAKSALDKVDEICGNAPEEEQSMMQSAGATTQGSLVLPFLGLAFTGMVLVGVVVQRRLATTPSSYGSDVETKALLRL